MNKTYFSENDGNADDINFSINTHFSENNDNKNNIYIKNTTIETTKNNKNHVINNLNKYIDNNSETSFYKQKQVSFENKYKISLPELNISNINTDNN